MLYQDIPYRVVPNSLRSTVAHRREQKNYTRKTTKLIDDLMLGKTLLVDCSTKLGDNTRPHKTLYNYFSARGLRLRMHLVDDVDSDTFRGILLWAENFYKAWRCPRCEKVCLLIGDTKPRVGGCTSAKYTSHWWAEKPELIAN